MKIDFPFNNFFAEMARHLSARHAKLIGRFLESLFFVLLATGFLWAIIGIFLQSNIDSTRKILNLTISAAFLEAGLGHLLSRRWSKAIAWGIAAAGLTFTPGILYQLHGSSYESDLFLLCSAAAFFGFIFAIAPRKSTP